MLRNKHSVTLELSKCKGCTNCIKRCPTEAIRVRDGHAIIKDDKCIDCGECIRLCPYQAKKATYDKLEDFAGYKYKIALPAPAFYGQFNDLDDVDYILTALLECGFDAAYSIGGIIGKRLSTRQGNLWLISLTIAGHAELITGFGSPSFFIYLRVCSVIISAALDTS